MTVIVDPPLRANASDEDIATSCAHVCYVVPASRRAFMKLTGSQFAGLKCGTKQEDK